jgi:hypothetical protein
VIGWKVVVYYIKEVKMTVRNKGLWFLGSSSMLIEMMALLQPTPNVSIIGAFSKSCTGPIFRISQDLENGMMPSFPRIKYERALYIPRIIHLKQPRHIAHTKVSQSFSRGIQDMRASVPRTKLRKRNGSR